MVLFRRARGLALAQMMGRITGAAHGSVVGCRYVILAWRLRWMYIMDVASTVPCVLSMRFEAMPVLSPIALKDQASTAVRTIDGHLRTHSVNNDQTLAISDL